MVTCRYKWLVLGVCISVLFSAFLARPATCAEENLDLNQIPKTVLDGLKGKFPKAQIRKCTKEKEGDIVVYDIEFEQDKRKFEADILEDGTIYNWEKEITVEDLPETVRKAVESKYPKAALIEIMEITAVKDGKDALEGYEIVLKTSDKVMVEVTVAPNGNILEESGEEE